MSNPLETALSVAGVTEYIQLLLEDDPQLNQLWVTGEVSSLQDHRAGLFFTLSDSQGQAAIKCVVWNGQKGKLLHCPKLGSQILVKGSVRLYPKKGEYQLTVFQAIETGDGLQTLRYEQLRSRLAQEGLFDLERKRSLPPTPKPSPS